MSSVTWSEILLIIIIGMISCCPHVRAQLTGCDITSLCIISVRIGVYEKTMCEFTYRTHLVMRGDVRYFIISSIIYKTIKTGSHLCVIITSTCMWAVHRKLCQVLLICCLEVCPPQRNHLQSFCIMTITDSVKVHIQGVLIE